MGDPWPRTTYLDRRGAAGDGLASCQCSLLLVSVDLARHRRNHITAAPALGPLPLIRLNNNSLPLAPRRARLNCGGRR